MKTKHLAAILSTMIYRGADVSFFSSYYGGFCFFREISGETFVEYVYDPENAASAVGGLYRIHSLTMWVELNKKDVESFILTGGAF